MTDEEIDELVYKARRNGAAVITYDETVALCKLVQQRVAREAAELCEKANQLDENDSGAAATGGALYARDAIRARFGLDPTTEEQPK